MNRIECHGASARLVLCLVFCLVFLACRDAEETPASSSTVIGPAGATLRSGGAALIVPPGALDGEVAFELATDSPPTALPAHETAVGGIFRFTPHGQPFLRPVTIELPAPADREGLQVLVLDDPSDTTWEAVSGVRFDGGVATFEVEHLCFFAVTRRSVAAENVLHRISIPKATAVLVNGSHDLVVFDASIDDVRLTTRLRFVDVSRANDGSGFTFELASEEVELFGTAHPGRGWIRRDRYHDLVYALVQAGQTNDASLQWDLMQVYVLSGRTEVGWFTYNPDGGKPLAAPEDFRIAVAGFTLKEAGSEEGNATRLFIHDIVGGNVEILDLDETGTTLISQKRHSYRERLEEGCSWPPAPAPWDCRWLDTIGNTLALEWRLESETPAGLADRDQLYLTDHNYSGTQIRVLSLAQSGAIDVQDLADVDMRAAHDIFANGIEGLTMSAASDVLYVATGLQSFGEGFLGTVDTATRTPGAIIIPYSDKGDVLVDPSDSSRIFVAASDSFQPNSPLLIHVLRQGTLTDTIRVLEGYDGRVSAMDFDAEYNLLYVLIEGEILVVQID